MLSANQLRWQGAEISILPVTGLTGGGAVEGINVQAICDV